ncbi:hypothetical protein DB35_04660 [Streptomyces abyssalis]|uniref:Peptidase inhibitor n=1 Tax=Streptomyces abyssalis TaxID=933944 RepID=A0A1E7JQC6_9ACTN|nr:peptidase inhibitor family I36 protein [Streptomyces abyssalis]OEU90492.1 hypothetical protein AN215_13750 [Streptomyces abyssalis]OEU95229.1 hypothetical protein DB35_04660 [Streptomyces abyssalis]OEV27085.1 hypothetical protein AN219_23715 [Streptomyces nanshensis]
MRKAKAAAATLLLATGIVTASGTAATAGDQRPASAAEARAQATCPAEHVCFYPGKDYTGTPQNVNPANLPVCGATPLIAYSVYNNSRDVYTFYSGADCTGGGQTINPATGVPNFDSIGERVASWR